MLLTGPEIKKRMQGENPDIVIKPFDERCLGSNSYDLHLGNTLKVYTHTIPRGMKPAIPYKGSPEAHTIRDWFEDSVCYDTYMSHPQEFDVLNPKYLIDPTNPLHHETTDIEILETGILISPYIGYLGSTLEYTEAHNLFPEIDGKSSTGLKFIVNHHTAGRGDDGFCGQWTLEIRVMYPTVVYPYMRIGQIYFKESKGERKPYNTNKSSHYNGQMGPTPAAPVQVDLFLKDMVQKQK